MEEGAAGSFVRRFFGGVCGLPAGAVVEVVGAVEVGWTEGVLETGGVDLVPVAASRRCLILRFVAYILWESVVVRLVMMLDAVCLLFWFGMLGGASLVGVLAVFPEQQRHHHLRHRNCISIQRIRK